MDMRSVGKAAFVYIEPFATRDIDVTAKLVATGQLASLASITSFLERHGIPANWVDEGLYLGGYPVQFLPDTDPLDADALANARAVDNTPVPFRVWSMEHLMAKCLQVGRPKDHARLALFLARDYDIARFCDLVRRFDLTSRWSAYCLRNAHADVCRTAPHTRRAPGP